MTERIYIPLLNEGVDVWRPVEAEKLSDGTYLIPANLDPAAQGETWGFQPGSVVVCRPRKTSDATILAAVGLAGSGRQAV